MLEVLAKDQFVDALPDEDMQLRIRQNKPATLRDALGIALELESYHLASKQKARFVQEVMFCSSWWMLSDKSQKDRAGHGSSPRPGRRTSLTRVTWSAGSARRGAIGGVSVLTGGVVLPRLRFPSLETSSSRA